MDKTVPAGAAILLDFIRKIEVGRTDRAFYNVIDEQNQSTKLLKPFISMMNIGTRRLVKGWNEVFRLNNSGWNCILQRRFQFIKNSKYIWCVFDLFLLTSCLECGKCKV